MSEMLRVSKTEAYFNFQVAQIAGLTVYRQVHCQIYEDIGSHWSPRGLFSEDASGTRVDIDEADLKTLVKVLKPTAGTLASDFGEWNHLGPVLRRMVRVDFIEALCPPTETVAL